MASIPRLNLSFSRFTDSGLLTKSAKILLMMTDNPNFLTPVPPLEDLQAAISAYEAALKEADGDKLKTAIKNTARTILEAVLGQLGRFISYVANGNVDILVSSGYDLAKQREPATLAEPGLVKVVNGITTGRLNISMPRVKGAYSYLHQITPDPLLPTSVWESQPHQGSKGVFNGLIPGQKYWIRIAAVGSGTQVAFSNIVSQIAL